MQSKLYPQLRSTGVIKGSELPSEISELSNYPSVHKSTFTLMKQRVRKFKGRKSKSSQKFELENEDIIGLSKLIQTSVEK